MPQWWKDLIYEPVLFFTVITVGLTAAQAQIDNVWLNLVTVVMVAVGGVIARRYTASKQWLKDTYGAKPVQALVEEEAGD